MKTNGFNIKFLFYYIDFSFVTFFLFGMYFYLLHSKYEKIILTIGSSNNILLDTLGFILSICGMNNLLAMIVVPILSVLTFKNRGKYGRYINLIAILVSLGYLLQILLIPGDEL